MEMDSGSLKCLKKRNQGGEKVRDELGSTYLLQGRVVRLPIMTEDPIMMAE